MRLIGREADLEKINRIALKMAREVADDTGTLMAGGICNSKLYCADMDKETKGKIWAMFREQVIILSMTSACIMNQQIL